MRIQLPVALSRRRAAVRQPELEQAVRTYLEEQNRLEMEQTPSLDAAAEPSARLLSYMAALTARDDRERLILDSFGYCLGRWIYLIDAVDDMAEDLEAEGYNPYLLAAASTKARGRNRRYGRHGNIPG